MTFSVNGIKQEKNNKYPVEMLICEDVLPSVRKFLEQKNILILSLKAFTPDKATFGDIYLTTTQDDKDIDIVTKYVDIQEAANFFTFIGFDIKRINRFSKPLSQKEIDNIIDTAKKDAEQKISKMSQQREEEEQVQKKIYEDAHLESAKKIVVRVFEKITITTIRSANTLSLQDKKQLSFFTDELKKLRMGTNFEKIREIIEQIFQLIQKIDTTYYASLPVPPQTIFSESLITSIDVERELERLENIKILKSLGAHISLKNQDYATFGASAIFRKFLQKDLLHKLSNLSSIFSSLYDIGEFVFVIAVSLLGIYTVANEVYLFSDKQFGLAFSLISVGIWWLILFSARYFRNKNIGRLLILLGLAFIIHYLLMWLVTTNFAL